MPNKLLLVDGVSRLKLFNAVDFLLLVTSGVAATLYSLINVG